MPFPFLPGGAILAAAVLVGALTAFGLLLRAMDRAIVGVRDTVITGIVSGLRTWGARRTSGPAEASRAAEATSPATPASSWSLAGTQGWPISPLPARAPGGSVPPEATSQAELIDLGTRRIDPREHPGR